MKNFDSIESGQKPSLHGPRVTVSTGLSPAKVDLLGTTTAKKPRKIFKTILALIFLCLLAAGVYVAARAINLSNKIFVGQKTSFIHKIGEIIRGSSGQTQLQGEDLGQVNILLLGIGGEGHDGPYLTDTIILAQIRPDLGQITLTHIPRDYLTDLPDGFGQQKINAAFAQGYSKSHDYNTAGQWARQSVEKMSGLSVPYFAVIDFNGFEKAIDQVGGVDVHIDRTFTDYSYPNDATNGYLPPVTFKEGDEHMNGSRALIFSRSRHAAGPEGSDFARGQRQQKIIEAFKSRVFQLNMITDAGKINSLLDTFADHFHTNLGPGEIFRLYSIAREKNLSTASLSLDPETNMVCPEILESNGAYVLVPCPGKSEEDIKNFFKNSFAISRLNSEQATVWLASSTGDKQAYKTAYRKLVDAGITVFELSYSKDNLPHSIVYQANPKPATVEFITNTLNASEVTLPPPSVHISKDRVDAIVILGQDALVEPDPAPYIAPPSRKATATPETDLNTDLSTSTPDYLPTSTLPSRTATSTLMKLPTTTPAQLQTTKQNRTASTTK